MAGLYTLKSHRLTVIYVGTHIKSLRRSNGGTCVNKAVFSQWIEATRKRMYSNSFSKEDKHHFILHDQHHIVWRPVDAMFFGHPQLWQLPNYHGIFRPIHWKCKRTHLTHGGLVTPFGDTDLGQHWLGYLSHYSLNLAWKLPTYN